LYRPGEDAIYMPDRKQFKSIEGFYSTMLHEMVHSTGHHSRLNRLEKCSFGDSTYAFEELIAELGTMFILGAYGIKNESNMDNNKAYIKSWLKALKNDSNYIFKASKQADKAFNWIQDNVKKESPVLQAC
jgi:antirestriction protein ArdC